MTMGTLNLTLKAVDDGSPNGDFEAILSTTQTDRDGETIKAGALNPLPQTIPIYYSHDWRSGALPVAKGTPFYDGDVLKVKGTYAGTERGQEMRSLVTDGIVQSMSVGFIKSQARGKVISKGELFEASFTGIPVNTGAKVLASKAYEDIDPMPGFDPQLKAMEGSYEDLAEDLREALVEATPGDLRWLYIRGTFPDHVVYDICTDDSTTTTWSADYTANEDGSFTIGAPTQVDVEEVVVATGDDATKSVSPTADAPAAAPAAAGTSADEDARMQFVARSLEQLAAI